MARVPTLLIALLFISSAALAGMASITNTAAATSGRGFTCNTVEAVNLPFNGMVDPQTCTGIDMGILAAGTVLEIQLTTDAEIDILVFSDAGFGVYKNEQTYRTDTFWETAATIESVNGSVTYHWTTPSDRGDTQWHVVLDNMAHAQDGGGGSQGVGSSTVQLSVTQPAARQWTLVDDMVFLLSGEKYIAMDGTTFAEGTEILIEVFGVTGDADVFMMTQSQKDSYLSGQSADFRISSTDLLSITSVASATWSVPAANADQPLYLIVDNAAGPAGGGSGANSGRVGVVLSIMPVLEPTITSSDMLGSVDVGEMVTLESSMTPNAWNQIDSTSRVWSTATADCEVENGSIIELCWNSPGVRNVSLSLTSTDGRSASSTIAITVADTTPPSAEILVNGVVKRGFGESFSLSARSSDNWMVASEEWWVDGEWVSQQNMSGSSFTHQFNDLNDAGNHSVKLRVIDAAGLIGEANASIQISDTTAPELGSVQAVTHAMVGDQVTFELSASDPESPTLVWNWDFDREVDADGDGIADSDVEATGNKVTMSYQASGPHWVVARVRNEANLIAEVEFLITITADPAAEQTSGELPFTRIILGIVVLTLLVGGFAFWQNTQKKANDIIAAEQEASIAAANAATAYQGEPSTDEQLQMFAPDARSTAYQSEAGMGDSKYRRSLIDPQTEQRDDSGALAALRGDDSEVGKKSFTATITSGLLEDGDDDEAGVGASSADAVTGLGSTASVTSNDAETTTSTAPSTDASTSDITTGENTSTPKTTARETAQTPSVGAGIALPESRMTGEAPAEPEPSIAANDGDWPDADGGLDASEHGGGIGTDGASGTDSGSGPTTISNALDVESVCSACGDGFEVTLPAGVEAARTACPFCGVLQDLRRPN
jgi:hypothetical protein